MNYYDFSLRFLKFNHNFQEVEKYCKNGLMEQNALEWNLFCNYVHNNYEINFGLEIGSFCGGTLHSLCFLASDNATIISIDDFSYINKDIFGTIESRNNLFNKFKKPNQKLFLLNNDSKDKSTILNLKEILNGNKLDYLFIDADHSYNGIKNDFENYIEFLNPSNSIVGFHDYTYQPIFKYLNEIRNEKYKIRRLASYQSDLVYIEL